jgi:hypothetical protein
VCISALPHISEAHQLTAAFTILSTLTLSSANPRPEQRQDESEQVAFVYPTDYGNITYAATVVRDVGDLYFHIEAPADNSWAAVGVGTEMKGSLIWVFYRNENGDGKHIHIPHTGASLRGNRRVTLY